MVALVEAQLDVLLVRDERGRIVATRNEPASAAPRLFLGRSAEGNAWGVRSDVEAKLANELERICAKEPRLVLPSADSPPACLARVRSLLGPLVREWRGPAYVLPDDLPRDDRAREVTAADSELWRDAFPWLADAFDALAPVVIAFEGGQAAALCHSPRGCTDRAAEAGVETLPSHRGRGLATAAVACWARSVQRSGRLALYSTSWQNTTSQAVARRLSARLYGEDWHLT